MGFPDSEPFFCSGSHVRNFIFNVAVHDPKWKMVRYIDWINCWRWLQVLALVVTFKRFHRNSLNRKIIILALSCPFWLPFLSWRRCLLSIWRLKFNFRYSSQCWKKSLLSVLGECREGWKFIFLSNFKFKPKLNKKDFRFKKFEGWKCYIYIYPFTFATVR